MTDNERSRRACRWDERRWRLLDALATAGALTVWHLASASFGCIKHLLRWAGTSDDDVTSFLRALRILIFLPVSASLTAGCMLSGYLFILRRLLSLRGRSRRTCAACRIRLQDNAPRHVYRYRANNAVGSAGSFSVASADAIRRVSPRHASRLSPAAAFLERLAVL